MILKCTKTNDKRFKVGKLYDTGTRKVDIKPSYGKTIYAKNLLGDVFAEFEEPSVLEHLKVIRKEIKIEGDDFQ